MTLEAHPEKQRPRILFVDDEPDLLMLFENLCRKWGFDSRGVGEARQAREAVADFRPDLIFLDLMMPGMNGFEVLRQIKTDPALGDIPVVMLTGGGVDVNYKVEGLTSGATDYLLKPVDPEEMLARIKGYLATQSRANKLAEQRELDAVRKTATFLNHSINNLLATIEVAAGLVSETDDPDQKSKAELISEKVFAIHDIVKRLREIQQIVVTTYPGSENMLDLDKSVGRPGARRPKS